MKPATPAAAFVLAPALALLVSPLAWAQSGLWTVDDQDPAADFCTIQAAIDDGL